ncbi:MAG: hypothetical protein U0984_11040 [Prosthecobacter sp.]|nr:hypothetical protein [Prosthecobacter sp.]
MNTPADPPPAPHRSRALLLLLFVFLLGAASGIGGGLLILRGLAQRAFAGDLRDNSPVEFVVATLEKQLSSELDLTPEERQAARRELAVTVTRFKDLRTRLRTDARAVVEDTLVRVEQHLPPEKRVRLRERAANRLRPWGLVP